MMNTYKWNIMKSRCLLNKLWMKDAGSELSQCCCLRQADRWRMQLTLYLARGKI